jgi:hypothetical protein
MNSIDLSAMPESRKLLIFFLMALGQFMALLDIQIVASSVAEISAGLAAAPDEASWIHDCLSHGRNRHDSALGSPVACLFHALAFYDLGDRIHASQHRLRIRHQH